MAVRKTKLLLLVMFISITMFCSSESARVILGFDGFPDSYYNRFGDGFGPDRYNIGDTIKFDYCPHNMIRVGNDDFYNCDPTNPISALTDNTFTFEEFGDFYFICKESWLCDDLQRDYVRVGSYEPIIPDPMPQSSSQASAPISPTPSSAPCAPSPSQTGGSYFYSRKVRLFGN